MKHQKPRRGIVLLIVLSLLTLFALLMVTFLVISGQYQNTAIATSRIDQTGDHPKKLLDSAMYQLVRDTRDPKSVVQGHSLLNDMYALTGFKGTISGAGSPGTFTGQSDGTGDQFLEVRVPDSQVRNVATGSSFALRQTSGYYNGCVLTMTSGNVRGLSLRIVNYWYFGGNGFFQLFRPLTDGAANVSPAAGDRFVVNGHAFSGTGFGYSSTSEALDRSDPGPDGVFGNADDKVLTALRPNRYLDSSTQLTAYLSGGANESYDVPDYNNLALAAMIDDGPLSVVPSFHRPALVNYWFNWVSDNWLTPVPIPPEEHLSIFLQPYGADNILGPDPSTGVNDDPQQGTLTQSDLRQIAQLKRDIILRPLPEFNPDFSGGTAAFSSIGMSAAGAAYRADILAGGSRAATAFLNNPYVSTPYDIDNDGDGVPDSIWVDLDLPVQTGADGRMVKPVFSFLVVDLDGRLNINAHGSLSHLAGAFPAPSATTKLARGVASLGQPEGQGYGPPEINLSGLFSNQTQYDNLLRGRTSGGYTIPGRYGSTTVPGRTSADAMAFVKFFEFPRDYYDRANNATVNQRAYHTPPDLRGELAFGLDHRGMPTYEVSNSTASPVDLISDSPYEMNLDHHAARGWASSNTADAPYSLTEFERLLRYRDHDALLLPKRLVDVVPNFKDTLTSSAALARRLVTTDSYDLPSPNVYLPGLGVPRHITDLFRSKMISGHQWSGRSITPQMEANLSGQLSALISPDLVMGLRMDVNRPFGNAEDDLMGGRRNGVVDEHGIASGFALEAGLAEKIWSGTGFDHDNDGDTTPDGDAFLARQHYARHLYLLMMALKPAGYQIDVDGITAPNARAARIETATAIAQWVVNVVDFRDADSIMTPFEFDTHPFSPQPGPDLQWGRAGVDDDGNGTSDDVEEALWPGSDDLPAWSVDGVLSAVESDPDRGLVWGCERPEMLLTSTLAFHDRRTEDLASPSGLANDPMMPDGMRPAGAANYDQRLRPRGSLFIELYNPWASNDERRPAEFYRDNTNTPQAGIVLDKTAPGNFPVWRLAIVSGPSHNRAAGEPLDPDNPTATPAFRPFDVERAIYFVNPYRMDRQAGAGRQLYYPSSPIAPLLPGRYAVVGSAGVQIGANFITTIGRRLDAEDNGQTSMMTDLKIGTTRRIILSPDTNPNVRQVAVADNFGQVDPTFPSIQQAIAVPIDTAIDLASTTSPRANKRLNVSISEPIGGYPDVTPSGSTFDPGLASGEGAYTPPLDNPLDMAGGGALTSDGTTPNYRTVYLQRLANPLLPYSVVSNPYRTIDRMQVDLTTFNGVHDPNGPPRPSPPIEEPFTTNTLPVRFNGTQRGLGMSGATNTRSGRNLWKQLPHTVPNGQLSPITAPNIAGGDNHVFNQTLRDTLGYLNTNYQGFFTAADGVPAEYYGAPDASGQPFPWLTWNNRPFVSQYELMQVPKSSSSKLLADFDVLNAAYGAPDDPYTPGNPAHFGHLLNFFEATVGGAMPATGGDFYRLFDFTHVPSRFIGTETILNPQTFSSTNAGTALLHAPFNRISNYRDPGKINLNTIYNSTVWSGLLGVDTHRSVPGLGPAFSEFVSARRAYDGHNAGNTVSFDDAIPTLFGRPFRGGGEAALVPVPEMSAAGVATTLLRNDASFPATPTDDSPVFQISTATTHRNSVRNPYFRYQAMQRMGNLVTTRSNVYAVWVTLAFFEVDPVSGTLGQELGVGSGDIKRHRAFYVIDRSIPVAFEPGENHNVDRAVRLRRFIE